MKLIQLITYTFNQLDKILKVDDVYGIGVQMNHEQSSELTEHNMETDRTMLLQWTIIV